MEPRGHALFEKLQTDAHLQHQGLKGAKPLLAPKGEYWDTAEEKVLGMFRSKLEVGLTEQEVLARRDVYGDNRTPPVPTNSVFKILLRQLADFIVLILLAGGYLRGVVARTACLSVSFTMRLTHTTLCPHAFTYNISMYNSRHRVRRFARRQDRHRPGHRHRRQHCHWLLPGKRIPSHSHVDASFLNHP